MTNSIIEQARGQWPYILESAGISPKYLKNKHGHCPICCEGKDRFRFDDKDGRGNYICNQCGAGDGIKLLMLCSRYDFKEALYFIERTLNGNPEPIGNILKRIKLFTQNTTEENSQEKRKRLIDVWSQSQSIVHGDPPDRYLQSRGIKLNYWPQSLRYHPNLPYYDDERRMVIGKFPAMIALVQNQHNKGVSLHRTYLGDGCKANVRKPKKLMSPAIKGSILGGSIRLYPPTKDGALVLAEGIETALAIHIATGLSVWATVSALGMERIILPTNLSNVIIAADNDHSGTGQKAAAELAYRLLADGKKVKCNSEKAMKILSLIETWILLGLDEKEITDVKKFKVLTAEQEALIRDIDSQKGLYAEAVLLGSRYQGLFRVIPPRYLLALLMTEKFEKAERHILEKDHDVLKAAEILAKRLENKNTAQQKDDCFYD